MELPGNYDPQLSEPKWQKFWVDQSIYKFNLESDKPIYSIDTPPPTMSGKMHIGHAFSYTQEDILARYKRMRGFNVFYPFGTDDNGLPTERLVEKMKGVKGVKMVRQDFIKLCEQTVDELRPAFVQGWKNIGMSCDFDLFYSTISEHCRKIAQKSFLELQKMGRGYRKQAPVLWCPQCTTAISQTECQDVDKPSTFNDIVFKIDGKDVLIATTRPELLPACVAVFAHPTDERYNSLAGKKAKVPLFGFEVPVLLDDRVDIEKGTGIVMCCTFGDQTDIAWYLAYNLPLKEAFTVDGKMTELAGEFKGLKILEARKAIIEEMKRHELLVKQKPIQHEVKVHERCQVEIEILNSKQWFIKYLDLREDLLKWGAELNWYPAFMKHRYDNWVKGLQWDWLISRQRFYGVPFPVWYCKKCDEPVFAQEKDLPVDPLKDKAPLAACKCGSSEFIPEKDVLDTWVTSSMTPQLAAELLPEKHRSKVFPMSLRPQASEIISFWLFNTLVKSQLHYKTNPWKDVAISGYVMDPQGEKMSKSKGNIVEPQVVLQKFGADAMRYWAGSSKLGEDIAYQEKELVTGKKTVTKLWNASKFCFSHLIDFKDADVDLHELDKWLLHQFNELVKFATESFDQYEYAKAKFAIDNFFWTTFCDYYLEMCKDRLYNVAVHGEDAKRSAQYTLHHVLLGILKFWAPFLPHITEEIYQTHYTKKEGSLSIHTSRWPEFNPNWVFEKEAESGDLAVELIGAVRKAKAEKKWSMGKEFSKLTIACPELMQKQLELVLVDVKTTVRAKEVDFEEGEDLEVALQE
ncbi:MAG: valine--tRNA ligase [Nanoarchaeota archaeon]